MFKHAVYLYVKLPFCWKVEYLKNRFFKWIVWNC